MFGRNPPTRYFLPYKSTQPTHLYSSRIAYCNAIQTPSSSSIPSKSNPTNLAVTTNVGRHAHHTTPHMAGTTAAVTAVVSKLDALLPQEVEEEEQQQHRNVVPRGARRAAASIRTDLVGALSFVSQGLGGRGPGRPVLAAGARRNSPAGRPRRACARGAPLGDGHGRPDSWSRPNDDGGSAGVRAPREVQGAPGAVPWSRLRIQRGGRRQLPRRVDFGGGDTGARVLREDAPGALLRHGRLPRRFLARAPRGQDDEAEAPAGADDARAGAPFLFPSVRNSWAMATAARRVHRKLSDVELVATETTKRLVADRVLNTSSPRKKALEEDDPRRPLSVPVLVPEAAALVGVNGQRDELARMLLVGEESGDAAAAAERQVVVIVGDAGMGKTTLAHEVYRAVGRHFRRRAWVSASENRS